MFLDEMLLSEKMLLNCRTKIMINRKMQFLNFKGFGFGSTDANVGSIFQFSACFACKTYNLNSKRFGYLYRTENIFRITRGADTYQYIVFFC